ncbi:MAG: O-antigen ligase family protein [Gammaproteobacteria bacterium]|nr:O-antigen ligase family protein [Gammaproteobacteria bacterium]
MTTPVTGVANALAANGVGQRLLALLPLGALLWMVVAFPVARGWLVTGYLAYALLLWRRPTSWLFVLPAALPVLNLEAWSGRQYFNAFDGLILVTLTVLLWRRPAVMPSLPRTAQRMLVFYCAAYAVSLLVGLFPLSPLDPDAFANIFSHYNALRLAKAFVLALALLPWLDDALTNARDASGTLAWGMTVGLLLLCLVIVMERYLFPGLFDLTNGHRVLGTFASMSTGGAALDASLVTAIPFLVAALLRRPGPLKLLLFVIVFALAGYAVLVTASRAPLVALLIEGLVLAVFVISGRQGSSRWWVRALVVAIGGILVCGAIALPFMVRSLTSERFRTIVADSGVRLDHWADSVSMLERTPLHLLFGMGIGSFPERYLWHHLGKDQPSTYRIASEQDEWFLRMGSGSGMRLTQKAVIEPATEYTLKLRARGAVAVSRIAICELWLTNSRYCHFIRIGDRGTGEPATQWRELQFTFNSKEIGQPIGNLSRLLRRGTALSLIGPEAGNDALDIDDVRLYDVAGTNLLNNGDFAAGLDNWLYSSDDHLALHAKNLFVHTLLEQGVSGLLGLFALVAIAVATMVRGAAAGDGFQPVLLAAMAGLFTIGLIDSLVDQPRIGWLLYLLLFTALNGANARRSAR